MGKPRARGKPQIYNLWKFTRTAAMPFDLDFISAKFPFRFHWTDLRYSAPNFIRLYQNELIFCMMEFQVFCGILTKTQEFSGIFTFQIFH